MSFELQEYKLSDAADILTGFPFRSERYSSEGLRVVRGENVTIGELRWDTIKCWNDTFNEAQKYSLKNGDVVIGMDGSRVGKNRAQIRREDLPLLLAQRVTRLRANDEFSQDFLAQVIKSSAFEKYVDAVKTGTSIPHISGQQIGDFKFFAPNLLFQQRIAAILSAFDDKIALNRQMNQTLEDIARVVFKGMLSINSKVPFLNYIELNPRLSIRKDAPAKFVEMRDLPEKGPSIEDFVMRPFSSGMKFQQNDTLLARITPCLENGKTAFVDLLEGDEVAHGSTEFIVMRAKPDVSPYYVYLLAREPDFREHAIKSMVGTSGRQRVQNDALIQYKLKQVDPDAMLRFHETVQPLFQQIKSNVDQSRTLATLRDSLLPKLMKGEINI